MTIYIALLRGINVGGRTRVAMKDLRQLFLALGHSDVQTYVQSGNVIFSAPARDASRLAGDIEERLTENLGVTSTVLLRTAEDLARVVANNPFLGPKTDTAALHVTFLADTPNREHTARLETLASGPDKLALVGREVYLHCPHGYGRTKLNNAFLERRLAVAATTRNWKTVSTLRDLAGA